MSKLKIKTKERRFETARDLYGIFFEDINRAGDGGLYPEMLRNRSFEDSVLPEGYIQQEDGIHVKTVSGWLDEFCNGEGLCRWVKGNNISETEIPAWYTHNAKMELELTDTLNEHRDAALRIQFEKDGSLTNTGYCGISVKAGESYSLYLFAKAKEEIGLDVAIEYQGKVLTGNSLVVSGQEYTRYDMKLTAAEDCHEAQLTISCKEGGEILLGFISLMPDNTYMGHGLRTDLVEKIKGMSPKFMRFPGGCIVEGTTPSTAMRFRDTVGPAWERPSKLFLWHYRSTLGLGFHEYLQLCEDLGMEPMYVCNCGMTCQGRKSVLLEGEALDEMVQDTLDAIEYAIGSKESKWGRLRASMGHPEPFKMTYLEIGNENWGPDYEKRYNMIYKKVKELYPQIKTIANEHVEKNGCPAECVDEHFYNTTEFFAERVNYYDDYDRKGPKIFVGEVAVNEGNYMGQLYAALGEAAFLMGIEKNQDIVTLASYAPLFENVNYRAWYPNLIRFNNHQSLGIPTYYVWKMFGQNRGEYVVRSEDEGGQCSLEEFGFMHDNKLTEDFAISVKPGEYHRFGYETDGKQIRLYVDGELQKEISIPYGPAFVSVVTDTKDEIIIKAVNFAGDVDPVSITLDCQVQGDYTVTLLSGEKGDENSFEEPEKVKNITVNMHGASSEFVYEAPPYSVSVLRLKKCEAF
ncbi:alpha-L-arabinofuranosidase [Agathobacter rectalis]|uniref:alpha-L-arabinofuranosidase C-terminal domain-containing protein n=1 Tax=Agathobacter rectalis TaxID=39491 RepID=UPI0021FFF843|nr:alpha-L-arabinofuranosidase C-terminal domain-containing protein [Agathobacter rectalis]UTB42825.1 alpha-L-arabinofuranosidase [Agathobacter rectalis]